MLADELDYLIGVDTHRDEHVLVAVAALVGTVLASQAVPASARGYREALLFAERYACGRRRASCVSALHWSMPFREQIGDFGLGADFAPD